MSQDNSPAFLDDHVFGGPAMRQPRPKRKKSPKETLRPTGARRVLSIEASAALHLALLLLIAYWPQKPEVNPPEVAPIEVSFLPQPMAPQDKVAPPGPQTKPEPEALPQAPEKPAPKPAPAKAAAPKHQQPKPAVKAHHEAPKHAQREVPKPKAPDLQALLNARMNQDKTEEEQRLARLRAEAHAGSKTAPDAPAAGLPKGDPTTAGSGLSGALASRQILNRVLPAYPPQAQRLGDEGTVRVRLWVGTDGRVSRVTVVRSSGRSYFDRAAVAAVRQWSFNPLADGTGDQYGDLTLTFDLQ